jgi:alkylation response protein AidB-like acyl-CoA dehydrogenase
MDHSLVNLTETLTRERLAPRAARYDQEACHPRENWQDLWKEGLLGLNIPRSHGGLEVDPPTYVNVVERIARGCASTAMTLHMHSTATRFIAALGTEEQQRRYFPEVLEHGKLLGSWGSEPPVSLTRTFLVETEIRRVDGGHLVNGLKHFCTMAGAASYYLVWGALEGEQDMAKGLVQAVVPADSSGVEIVGGWDPLGMRATVSPGVRFTGCFVAGDGVLGPGGAPLTCGVIEQFGLGYAAVYLGTAQGALDVTAEYCRTKVFAPDTQPIGNDPLVQRHIGEMAIALDSARLLLDRAASEWPAADRARRGLLSAQAKYAATEAGLLVTARCLQVCGGRSALKSMPVERAFRDLRTATLMPPNADSMLGIIGRDRMGMSTAAFKY